MQAALVIKVEAAVNRVASALFAAACAFAAYRCLAVEAATPLLAAETAAAAALGYALSLIMLGTVQAERRRPPFSVFDVRHIDIAEPAATSESSPEPTGSEPLLLDDILSEMGPDSRVVRLFDPAAMPTPGELKLRIDRHLCADASSRPEDAVEALHEALAELRRSLR